MQLLAVLLTLAALAVTVLLARALARTSTRLGFRTRLAFMTGDVGAVDTFIPEVWSAELLTTLHENYVLASPVATNRNYEGEIRQAGDTVHIGSISRPTISNYVKNVTAISPQTLTTTDQSLVIDQSKYFAFEVDDIDKRQVQNGGRLLTQAASEAADGLQEAADTYLGTIMTAGAGTVLTAMDITTSAGAFQTLLRLKVALDRANVPQNGRFVAVSPEFHAMLVGDNRFLDASASGDANVLRNGLVGYALGFKIMVSTNLPTGTAGTGSEVSTYIIAGHSMATTYADQINNVEAYRPNDSFSDAIKGLHVYGAEVIRPEALAVIDVDVTVPTS